MSENPPPQDEQVLAGLLAALRAPAMANELVVPDRVLAALDARAAAAALPSPRRKSMIGSALAAKGLVAAATLALTTAGAAAAAMTGHLPAPLQAAAHRALGAPAAGHGDPAAHRPGKPAGTGPTPSVRPTGSAVGPDAQGSAAAGLCTAFARGGLATTSTAYRNLAQAAGGPDAIPAFCATVRQHGTGRPGDRPGAKPGPGTGKPTDKPTDKPGGTGRPTGKPGSTGKPTDKPGGTGRPTGNPAGHTNGRSPLP